MEHMSASSLARWPVEIKIVKVVDASALAEAVSVYFITSVMNAELRDTLAKQLPIQAEFPLEDGRFVISTIVTHAQLMTAYEAFTPKSKSWRGAYYVVTNKFVSACNEVLGEA